MLFLVDNLPNNPQECHLSDNIGCCNISKEIIKCRIGEEDFTCPYLRPFKAHAFKYLYGDGNSVTGYNEMPVMLK